VKSSALRTIAAVHGRLVHRRRVRILADAVSSLIPRDSTVLDVGSGDGLFAIALLQLRPDLRVEGIDVLQRPGVSIPTKVFDGVRIPHGDGSFDAVILIDVLHHAADGSALLAEAARIAATTIVIKDHFREGFAAQPTLRLMDWLSNRSHGVALRYQYLSRAEWLELFARRGLTLETMRTRLRLYPPPFAWLFERSLHFLAALRPAPQPR
jgi:SAM-dependent methyltransferase